IVSYFYIFGDLGLSMYGIREIAKNRDRDCTDLISKLYSVRNIVNSVVLLFFLIVVYSQKDGVIFVYLLICILNIISNYFNVEWVNEAFEKFRFITIKTIIVRLLFIIAIIIFVKGYSASYYYLLLTGLALLINNVI